MSTVHREDGYRFVIWSNDHPPAHVHAIRGGGVAVIEIRSLAVRSVRGLRDAEVVKAVRIVEANRNMLLRKWRKIHGR
jgi:hypothetical protein